MVYVIYLCFAIPLALMLPLLEQKGRRLIGFMLIGATVAVSAAEVNGALGALMNLTDMETALLVAPIVEELMKAIPVLLFAIFVSDKRGQVLSLSMATGIGFAILENCYILVSNISVITLGWALLRGLSTSLLHGMSTFLVGCGILFVHKQKKLFYTGIFALLAVAITLHAIFNLLIYSEWSMIGMVLPIALYLGIQIVRKGRRIKI